MVRKLIMRSMGLRSMVVVAFFMVLCLCVCVCVYIYICQASLCSSVLSRRNKDLEWQTLKPLARHSSWVFDKPVALRQISVTALFYLEDSRKIHLQSMRARRTKDVKRRAPQRAGEREWERERELALAPLFMCLSLSGPVLCKLGQPGVFILSEVLTPVLGPSFVLFLRAFPFLVF